MIKKYTIIAIVVCFVISFIIVGAFIALSIGVNQSNDEETFLFSSVSPNQSYTLEAYKSEPGATIDFSIKVYLISEGKKELIYNAYHEYEAEIVWISDTIVSINGKQLDLQKREKYDWRENSKHFK